MKRKKAIEVVKNNLSDDIPAMLREALETLVPELGESDGERIRKWIIEDIRYNMDEEQLPTAEYKKKAEKAIAWLERQVERKPKDRYTFKSIPRLLEMVEPTDRAKSYCQKLIDSLRQEGYITDAKIISNCLKQMNGEEVSMAVMDETQDGDAPSSEEAVLDAGPEFNVGDWVATNDGTKKFLIKNITWNWSSLGDAAVVGVYCELEDTDGVVHYPCLLSKSSYHHWTIGDAEDGDVLYSQEKNLVWIYKSKGTYHTALILDYAQYHGCVTSNCDFIIPPDTHPATLKQRELLFSKMREAGYEWDAGKKELHIIKRKPADKAEPKFKPGDWIVCDGIDSAARITGIDSGSYEAEFFDGTTRFSDIEYVDGNFRLWTVRDAKDGDVLVNHNDEVPFIFKGFLNQDHPDCPVAYCGINDAGKFKICSGDYFWEDSNVKPATKEQRDLLFSKMRDAGYEWDAGNKLLNRLL